MLSDSVRFVLLPWSRLTFYSRACESFCVILEDGGVVVARSALLLLGDLVLPTGAPYAERIMKRRRLSLV